MIPYYATKPGQGVVAQGTLTSGNRVEAREVLAKHDEKYTPPEVTSAMSPARQPPATALFTAAAPVIAGDASGANARPAAQSGVRP